MQPDPALLARLPRTFVPALNEQMRGWDLLFPAEQRTIRAQLDWLARLPSPEFDRLFDAIKKLEGRMELPAWDLGAQRVSINDTSMLVRSPYYREWRAAVEQVFEQVDAGVSAEQSAAPPNRLLMCMLPAGLPLGSVRSGRVSKSEDATWRWRSRLARCWRSWSNPSPTANRAPES